MLRVTVLVVGLLLIVGLLATVESQSLAQAAGQAVSGQNVAGQKGGGLDRAKLLQKHPELDLDKDGALSDEELKAARERLRNSSGPKVSNYKPDPRMFGWMVEHFAELDLDRNTQISREELLKARDQYGAIARSAAAGPEAILKQYPQADTNGDGKLSRDEYKAFMDTNPDAAKLILLQRHPEADTNGDGTLSDEEYQAAQSKAKPDAKAGKATKKPAKKKGGNAEAPEPAEK
jgi:hypothetical protein